MKFIELIDRGGFGRVEKIELANGDIIAKKTFDPKPDIILASSKDKLLKRFKREVLVQSQLPNEFFIPILDYSLEVDEPWFTMPLCDKNFEKEIKDAKSNRTIPNGFGDILNAIETLHDLGYVHRDLKPQNVLFHENKWKLSDFGLITSKDKNLTTVLTSIDSAWGSEMYSAPEQVSNFRNVTNKADIYSFGAILHDIFSNNSRIPYQKHTCNGQIGLIIEKCTEFYPKKRFKNINSLRGSLLSILSQLKLDQPEQNTQEFLNKLKDIGNFDNETFKNLILYLRECDTNEKALIYYELKSIQIETLHTLNPDLWDELTLEYCDWVSNQSFVFDYCDVIAINFKKIYDLGDNNIKANTVIVLVKLGISHNRWFVMKKVVFMCSKNITNELAYRISIEMKINNLKSDFINTVKQINLKIDSYHDIIVEKIINS
jgi:serine/threonine protein kinase